MCILIAEKSRTRPLSASRRKPSTDESTEDKNADEIFQAMAIENQNIGKD